MVVLKHNGLVYIAVSQAYQRDLDSIRTGKVNPEDLKAYHPRKRKNQLIATNGVTCATEAFRYENAIPKELNMKSLILGAHPLLCHISEFFGKTDGRHASTDTVFAQDSDAYILYKDGTCLEIEDVYACGTNSDIAFALYDAEGVEKPNDFFKKVFTMQEEIYGTIMFPIAVLNTGSNKISVINRR